MVKVTNKYFIHIIRPCFGRHFSFFSPHTSQRGIQMDGIDLSLNGHMIWDGVFECALSNGGIAGIPK